MANKLESQLYTLKLAQGEKEQFFLQNEHYWLTSVPAISGNRQIRLEQHGNWQLLVCHYLPGISFARVLRHWLPHTNHAQKLAPLLLQLKANIEMCHANSCIHADLKPSNILLVAGQLTLIDFANARALGYDLSTTSYYSYNQSYSLPNQRLGDSQASVSWDWFSFFVLLEIAMQAKPATIDWHSDRPLQGVFDGSLERFESLLLNGVNIQELRTHLNRLSQWPVI